MNINRKILAGLVFTSGIILLNLSGISSVAAAIINTVTIRDVPTNTLATATSSIEFLQDTGPFDIAKAPNRTVLDPGEEVMFTVTISNITSSSDLTNVSITDNFPEDLLEIQSVIATGGISCYYDAVRINCLIPQFNRGATYQFTSRFKALKSGVAQNTVTAESASLQSSDTATVIIRDSGNPLAIIKSPNKVTVSPGELIEYNITVANQSAGLSLRDVVLTDNYPSDLLELKTVSSTSGMECQYDATQIRCRASTLPPGSVQKITTRYVAKIPGTASNTIQAIDLDGNSAATTSTVIIRDPGNPFIITKAPNKAVIELGEEVEYVISITNRVDTLEDVVIIDDFQEDLLELMSVTSSSGLICQNDASEIRCRMGRFPGDTTYSIIARYRAIEAGVAQNTVTATEKENRSNMATSSIIIKDVGNILQVTKNPSKSTVNIGERVDYTVKIENLSPNLEIETITLEDDFPENNLEILNINASSGLSCVRDVSRINCTAAQLPPGSTYTLVASYEAISSGNAQNTVIATGTAGAVEKNADASTNVLIVDPGNPMLLRKSPSKAVIDLGEEVEFRVELSNGTTANLTIDDVVIEDDYPEDMLEVISVTASQGLSCRHDADKVTCAAADLAPGVNHIVTTRYKSITPGTAQNNVLVTDDQDRQTNTNSNVIIRDPGNPFFLSKEPDKTSFDLGEVVTYTIVVTNRTKALELNNIDIIDDFPENLLRILSVNAPATNCQQGASDVKCSVDRLLPGDTRTITTRFESITAGTAENTVSVNDDEGRATSESRSVIIKDPGNPFLISLAPDTINPEVGEQVVYTITIANRTNAQTLEDITLTADYPEASLELQGVTTNSGITCDRDAAEIQCHIETMAPNDSYTITATFEALQPGPAASTVTISQAGEDVGSINSSIIVQEPEPTEIELSSSCEDRSILIGEECQLTVIARYEFLDEKNVTEEANFFNFQNIGTVAGGIFSATKAGTANITATFDSKTSNSIQLQVITDIGVGMDAEGNMITHFPARVTGGTDDTVSWTDPVLTGSQEASTGAVAQNNRIVLKGLGGSGEYNWFLEDTELGRLIEFDSGQICPENNNRAQCLDERTVVFESGNTEGRAIIRVSDDGNEDLLLTIHILPSALEKVVVRDEAGQLVKTIADIPRQQLVKLTAEKIYSDGSVDVNAEDELEWEFRFNGGEWTQGSEAGNISRGILQPIQTGTFAVRAKATQSIALPGVDGLTEKTTEIFSDDISIQVGDAVPFIESMRLAGNEGMAKGTTDTLYVRLRHFGTLSEIGDMELDLVKGKYTAPDQIPAGIQHFFIELVPEDIFLQQGQNKTALLEVPFFVPLLDDLKDGIHTLRLIINNQNGLPGRDSVIGVLPVYIGEPTPGDANLDQQIDLMDAVLSMQFVAGTSVPTPLQLVALDYDGHNGITLRDYLEAFRELLKQFLK